LRCHAQVVFDVIQVKHRQHHLGHRVGLHCCHNTRFYPIAIFMEVRMKHTHCIMGGGRTYIETELDAAYLKTLF